MTPAVRAEVERIADGTDAGKRATAIASLAELGQLPAAVPYLVGCLDDWREVLAFGGPFKGKTYVGTLATRALLRSGPPGIKALLEASHDLKKNALVQYGLAEMVPEESEALFSNTTGSERDRLIDELAAHTTDGLLAISKVGGAHALDIIAERIAADPDMICTTSQAVLVTLGKNRKSQTAALYVKGLRGSYTCEAMLRGFNDLTNQHFTSRADVERRWQANNATFK